jgi:flagellin
MRINNNIAALNTYNRLAANQTGTSKSLEKLSSGLRINRAGDDAAGLAISEKMRSQIRGLGQASRNAQDGISLIQTAEGALSETHSILQRMNELATQASNGTLGTTDRNAIQSEITQLNDEVDRISTSTKFNGTALLSATSTVTLQIGYENNQTLDIALTQVDAASLTINTVDVTSAASAQAAMTDIQAAIDAVSTQRANLGAYQNRLEHTINNLSTASENMSAAESRIRDVDMASEMMNFTKNNILTQAATAMLAQANQQPQGVLQLLR